MKCIGHGSLKCHSGVLKAKWHLLVGKGSPWENEGDLMLIFRFRLNLFVSREYIHEGEYFTYGTIINDLINKYCRIVVFGTSFVQIMEVSPYSYSDLFFVDRYRVGYPFN